MEDAIEAFGGTCLVVSHDRYFLDKVADRILELDHGKLTEYLGNYSYYKEKKQDLEALKRTGTVKRKKKRKRRKKSPGKMSTR